MRHCPHVLRGRPIGSNPEGVGALDLEQIRDLCEDLGNFRVLDRNGDLSS
jgi:hypothetical protein